MPSLNINTTAAVRYSATLEKLSRSALPVAVRTALNSAAFDVKQKTMPTEAAGTFIQRKQNFFKANSKVQMAAGFKIDTMQSTVGFVGNQQAVEDLESQEQGGVIGSRSFIPMNTARTGSSNSKMVRANARLSQIKKVVNAADAKGVNDGQRFIKSVLYAGVGGFVIGQRNGKQYLWRVNSVKRTDAGKLKLTPLYSFEKGRDVNVKATHFMQRASNLSGAKIEDFYIKEAEKQIKKFYAK